MKKAFAILRSNHIDKPNRRLSLTTYIKLNNMSYHHNECIVDSYSFCPLDIYKRDVI